MQLRNVMEDLVDGVLVEVLSRAGDACGCERCRLDMKAFALNNLPARYVVDDPSEVHRHLEALIASFKADVQYAVTRALPIVGARPKHARSAAGRQGDRD